MCVYKSKYSWDDLNLVNLLSDPSPSAPADDAQDDAQDPDGIQVVDPADEQPGLGVRAALRASMASIASAAGVAAIEAATVHVHKAVDKAFNGI